MKSRRAVLLPASWQPAAIPQSWTGAPMSPESEISANSGGALLFTSLSWARRVALFPSNFKVLLK
jgi:hypothetical protein